MPSADTPCVKVCALDAASGLCKGCGRDLDEITRWAGLDAADRQRILAALPERLRALGKRPAVI